MPIDQILTLLITERDKLNRAIEVLQGTSRAGRQGTSHGGRPRNSAVLTIDTSPAPDRKPKRRRWTAAMKLAAAERSKAMWAAKRRKAGAKKG